MANANADILKQIMSAIDGQSQTISTLSAQVKALDAKVNELNTALLAEQKSHTDDLTSVNAALQKAATQATNGLPTLSTLGQAATKQAARQLSPPPGNRRAVPN